MSFEEYWNDGFNSYDDAKDAAKDAWQEQQKKIDCCRDENKALLERLNKQRIEIKESLEALNDGEFNHCQSALENLLKGNQDD